jgi:hypothetical protein
MKNQPFKKKQTDILKEKAWHLYQEGKSLREVGGIIGKSYSWVWLVVSPRLHKHVENTITKKS